MSIFRIDVYFQKFWRIQSVFKSMVKWTGLRKRSSSVFWKKHLLEQIFYLMALHVRFCTTVLPLHMTCKTIQEGPTYFVLTTVQLPPTHARACKHSFTCKGKATLQFRPVTWKHLQTNNFTFTYCTSYSFLTNSKTPRNFQKP